jgi:hypothetical protein
VRAWSAYHSPKMQRLGQREPDEAEKRSQSANWCVTLHWCTLLNQDSDEDGLILRSTLIQTIFTPTGC